MIIPILFIFMVIGFMDLPRLIRNRHWPDLAVYTVLFSFALTLSLLMLSGVELPSTTVWIEHVIKDVLHFSYS